MFVHLGGLEDLALQELNNLFDVTLAYQVGKELKHFLVDLKGDH